MVLKKQKRFLYFNIKHIAVLSLLCIIILSCKKDATDYTALTYIPESFPSMEIPEDNHFTLERWQLGKSLFYDKKLSIDSSVSCATCHKIEFAFSDNINKTPGVNNLPGSRNAPTLTNIGFQPYYTKEGGVPTLERQVLIPIQEHNEMAFNILDAGERFNEINYYKDLSQKAYNREMDYYVITRALACFERSIISSKSPFDQGELSQSALNGKELFYSSQTKCSSCHSGVLFTDFSFKNNGLYETYEDNGKFVLSNDSNDIGVFKVPTLRNINLTAPYMHDGSLNTLEDVVEHYNTGGSSHPNKSTILEPLNLTAQEKNDLISFLESLSDYTFINNKLLSNE